MFEWYYSLLTTIFSPILLLPPVLAELIIGSIVIFIITLFYKYLVDQKQMKELKEKQKQIQKEIKELQKTNQEEANKKMKEMMALTNKIMMLNFRPMLPSMLLIIAILPWLCSTFTGVVANIPVTIPFLTLRFPFVKMTNGFGWLAWYFVISIPCTTLFRKILKVE